MKRISSFALVFVTSFMMSGCGTTPDKMPSEKSAEQQPALLNPVRKGLAPQNLASGECGLFIWTTDKTRTFIGFETSRTAKLYLNGRTRTVTREEEGDLTATERRYKLPDGQTVPLFLERGKTLKDGEGFSGQIVTKTTDGWDRVTPVLALASCVP